MKNLLTVSVIVNVVLMYILLKPVQKSTNFEHILIDRIRKEHKVTEERILKDSLRFVEELKIRDKKIKYIHKIRVNERNKFESEITKINNLTTDSSYVSAIDSIKKVCCSGTGR